MCGIAFFLNKLENRDLNEVWEQIMNDISKRGPDLFHSIENNGGIYAAGVLHIQGNEITRQPLIDSFQNILLWNGEVFDGIGRIPDVSDTKMISVELETATSGLSTIHEIGEALTVALSRVHGPYAFIYYHSLSQSIFYGRDPFGRRSLITLSTRQNEQEGSDNDNHNHHLLISSVCLNMDIGENYILEELPVSGVFCISLTNSQSFHFPWPESRLKLERKWNDSFEAKINSCDSESSSITPNSSYSEQFLTILKNVLEKRIHCVHSLYNNLKPIEESEEVSSNETCTIGVLFSGGIDSVLLAAVLHLSLPQVMNHLTIDLLNVTFEGQLTKPNDPSPDRLAAIAALGELETIFPLRKWRLVHIDITSLERNHHEGRIFGLIQPLNTHMDLNIGTAFWFASRGVGYLRHYSSEEYQQMYHFEENGRPLLRLGEEGARRGKGQKQGKSNKQESVQGSVQGEEEKQNENNEAVMENKIEGETKMKKLFCCRDRCRKVSKIGCPLKFCRTCCEKYQKERSETIENSEIESSVFCPVHRQRKNEQNEKLTENMQQKETLPNENTTELENHPAEKSYPSYTSPCKILLVGIGADEQMAGYGRHRTTFEKFGWKGLVNELDSDMTRLWKRNLGRDDRCASDHGRELWFPFLDENIVEFLQNTPIDQICDLTLPYGIGDKKILRDAGKIIGLRNSTELVKRAIQFGTRVAKHTNVKYHGSNRKGKGTTPIEYEENEES